MRVLLRNVASSLTLNLYREGIVIPTFCPKSLSGSECFRLPRLVPARNWAVSITGAGATDLVEEVRMATSMERLR